MATICRALYVGFKLATRRARKRRCVGGGTLPSLVGFVNVALAQYRADLTGTAHGDSCVVDYAASEAHRLNESEGG